MAGQTTDSLTAQCTHTACVNVKALCADYLTFTAGPLYTLHISHRSQKFNLFRLQLFYAAKIACGSHVICAECLQCWWRSAPFLYCTYHCYDLLLRVLRFDCETLVIALLRSAKTFFDLYVRELGQPRNSGWCTVKTGSLRNLGRAEITVFLILVKDCRMAAGWLRVVFRDFGTCMSWSYV